MQLEKHPTVKWFREQKGEKALQDEPKNIDAQWLRYLCIKSGADDVGFVDISRPAMAADRAQLLEVMHGSLNRNTRIKL